MGGDIGGAFKFLLVTACFGIAFIAVTLISAFISIFTPVSMFVSLPAALLVGAAVTVVVQAKVQ